MDTGMEQRTLDSGHWTVDTGQDISPPHWTVRSCMGNEIGTAKLPTVDGMWLPHRDADPEANDSATFYN